MDYKSIEQLIKTAGESGISFLEIETEGIKITMKKGNSEIEPARAVRPADEIALVSTSSDEEIKNIVNAKEEKIVEEKVVSKVTSDENLKSIKSPIVGTFYASSGPDAGPFVTVGSKVKKGQVLCIIEAMKLMNEIESEFDGEIVEILVENEQMVEYGQELFKIR